MKNKLWLGAVLLVVCCAHVDPHRDEEAIRARTQHYAQLVVAMDHAAIAAMFSPEGELEIPRGKTVQGSAAIERYLQSFSNFHVISDEMTDAEVTVHEGTALSLGTYRQRVRTPEGNVVDVKGRYVIQWVRGPLDVWLIRKMSTTN